MKEADVRLPSSKALKMGTRPHSSALVWLIAVLFSGAQRAGSEVARVSLANRGAMVELATNAPHGPGDRAAKLLPKLIAIVPQLFNVRLSC